MSGHKHCITEPWQNGILIFVSLRIRSHVSAIRLFPRQDAFLLLHREHCALETLSCHSGPTVCGEFAQVNSDTRPASTVLHHSNQVCLSLGTYGKYLTDSDGGGRSCNNRSVMFTQIAPNSRPRCAPYLPPTQLVFYFGNDIGD